MLVSRAVVRIVFPLWKEQGGEADDGDESNDPDSSTAEAGPVFVYGRLGIRLRLEWTQMGEGGEKPGTVVIVAFAHSLRECLSCFETGVFVLSARLDKSHALSVFIACVFTCFFRPPPPFFSFFLWVTPTLQVNPQDYLPSLTLSNPFRLSVRSSSRLLLKRAINQR